MNKNFAPGKLFSIINSTFLLVSKVNANNFNIPSAHGAAKSMKLEIYVLFYFMGALM